ncbi:MAG: LysM peptidoglycan-binding domain-containing protein [Pseudomonadota bacterium]
MPKDTIHTVRRGDTLGKIAKKYGHASWKTIYDAPENAKFRKNRPDPNAIQPGDKITIPPSAGSVVGRYFKNMPRMSISIDAPKALIFVQQKWQYVFVEKDATVSKWTSKEKTKFHNDADKIIWKRWSGKFKITCAGTSDFARVYKDTVFNTNFDIKRVTSSGHWTVTVTKVPAGSKSPQSSINWGTQVVNLDSEDMAKRDLRGTGKDKDKFDPVAHEFGHTAGNSKFGPAARGDEYPAGHANFLDKASIMNIGNQVRKRHADHLILMLNKMIKDTTWSVKSVG